MTPTEARAVAIERLLEEQDWVQRLARSLVTDPASADDLAQETWLAAVARPPERAQAPRAWLGTVLRRAFGKSLRSRGRRERREASAARPDGAPSAAELAAEAEMHARLAKAVLALDEPYRETVLRRFFDGATPREVARRMGVPVETVRTRTRRAVELLRAELDPRDPDRRRATAAALLALADRAGEDVTIPAPALAVAAVALLAIGGGVAWAVAADRGGAVAPAPGGAEEATATATLAAGPASVARAAVAGAPAAPVRTTWILDVRDALTGRSVPNAVACDVGGTGPDAVGDAQGRVAIATEAEGRRSIAVWAEGYGGTRRSRLAVGTPEPETVFLWPVPAGPGARRLAGRVEDAQGKPVAGALVRGVDRLGRVALARTDATGAFGATCAWNASPGLWVAEGGGLSGAAAVAFDRRVPWDPVAEATAIRLVASVEVPVRIRGGVAGLDLVVRAEPATRWLSAAGPREARAVDGTRLALPPGAWRLLLRTREGDSVARDAFVLVTARGILELGIVPVAELPDAVVVAVREDAGPLDAVTFDVEARTLRVRVEDEAGPLAGAFVTLEPAGESDPFVVRFGEYGPSHPSRKTGLSGFLTWGRRAPLSGVRSAVTGPDGVATVRGWLPAPARLRVRGAYVADAFRDLDEAEAARGEVAVRVARGAAVEVAWPSWQRGAILERVDGAQPGEAYRVGEDEAVAVVPAGRYVLRLHEVTWGAPVGKAAAVATDVVPGRDPVAVLHGPFEAKAGERTVVDLRAFAAPHRATLLFEVPGAPWVSCVPIWGAPEARVLADGRVSFPRAVLVDKERYGFGWRETTGGVEVARFHEVDVRPQDAAASGGELRFDARYEGHARRLRVKNREDAEVLVVAGLGREGDAPYLDQHRATFRVPARAEREVALTHLPAGTWWVATAGPGRATAWPERFEVGGDDSRPVEVTVRDDSFVVRVTGDDGKPLVGWLHVRLVPRDPVAAKEAAAELHGDTAWFARVPAGRWLLKVVGPAKSQPRPDHVVSEPWLETEIVVEEGSRSASVVVPRR
jgi:RNA polymerase sigma-70 factor (ECF subfamily)